MRGAMLEFYKRLDSFIASSDKIHEVNGQTVFNRCVSLEELDMRRATETLKRTMIEMAERYKLIDMEYHGNIRAFTFKLDVTTVLRNSKQLAGELKRALA